MTTANTARRNSTSENVIDNQNIRKLAPDTAKPKGARIVCKMAKSAKKAGCAAKPNGDRANKKAELIAMIEALRAASRIMKAMGWQPRTVRGYWAAKVGKRFESSQERRW